MDVSGVLPVIATGVLGYLLGSFCPAYILVKAKKHEGVREPSDVRRVFGLPAAGFSLAVDLIKAAAAVLIGERLFGISDAWLFVPAWCALLGHMFPFYLGFRGGRGCTPAAGLCLLLSVTAVLRGAWLPRQPAAVAAVVLLLYFASRNRSLAALVGFFFLAVLSLLLLGLGPRSLLMISLCLYGFALSVHDAVCEQLFVLDARVEMKWWRVIARPFALMFIPIDMVFGRKPLLFLMAAIGIILIGLDLFRLLSRHQLSVLFKRKENKRFSSMTSFVVALFIIFLVFRGVIPYLGLAYITVGDMFSKIVGIKFGTRKLLRDRTLEGSLAFLAGSFLAGWVIYIRLPVPLYAAIAGPIFAAAVELFSMDLDDNFTVGIVSSGFLFALHYFLGH